MFCARPLWVTAILPILIALTLVAPAWAGDIHGITVLTATERSGNVVGNNFFDVTILADGLQNARFYDYEKDTWHSLAYDAGLGLWHYRDTGYASLTLLEAVHDTPTAFMFLFDETPQGAFGDAVYIAYDRQMPTDFCHVTAPLPGQQDVPVNPTIAWDFAGEADYSGRALVKESTGETVFVEYFDGASAGTWAPGLLEADTEYSVVLGTWNVVTGDSTYISTLYHDYFTFIGIMNDSNRVTFTTTDGSFGGPDVPEPATLFLVGTGALGVLGYIHRRRMT